MAIPDVLQSHAEPFLKQERSTAAHGKGFSPGSSSQGKLGQEVCGWGHVGLGPAAAPALCYRQKGGAVLWLSGNQQHQRGGKN